MPLQQFNETTPINQFVQFLIADGTNVKDVFDGRPIVCRCDALYASNKGATPRTIDISVNVNGTQVHLGSATVAAGAGYSGTPAVDVLAASLPTGAEGYVLDAQSYIVANVTLAVVADNDVEIIGAGGNL